MKTLIFLMSFLFITNTSFSANSITVESELHNVKTYVINNQGYSCFNSFVKYASDNPEYWFRINLKFRDRLLPFIKINIDDNEYVLYAVEEYKKRHLKAGTGAEIDGNYNYQDFDCYVIPEEIITKLNNCKTACLIVESIKRQNMKVELNQEFITNMQSLIQSKYPLPKK